MNPYGHFDPERHEYVISRPDTPAPWINYLMGPRLAAFVSQQAGGAAWYGDPGSGRLSRYRFNGLPVDSPGFYVFIDDGQAVWNPSFAPRRTPLDAWECRHGRNYTRFTASRDGLRAELTFTIPPDADVMLWSLRLRNDSDRHKSLRLTTYLEFALHVFMADALAFLVCGNQWRLTFDRELNAIRSEYFSFQAPFEGRTLFGSDRPVAGFEIDRAAFIGPGRTEATAIGLEGDLGDSAAPDGGRYTCGALRHHLELPPGASDQLLWKYAVSADATATADLYHRYHSAADVDAAIAANARAWDRATASFRLDSPEPDLDAMVNTWLPINARVTFRFARSISTRHTGAKGSLRYRDSMQDAMPAAQLFPAEARPRIARILQTMKASGECVCSVNPETLEVTSQTRRSDNAVWGVFTVHDYVAETGDLAVLAAVLPFFDGGEGSVLDHLLRSLKWIADHRGKDGLPDLCDTDWNDFLQIFTVAYEGGQSVMLAEQTICAARQLAALCHAAGQPGEVPWLEQLAAELTTVLLGDRVWDGQWFRRVLGDDLVMGSAANTDARIFLNSQSWAVLAGLPRERTIPAMDAVREHLNTPWGLRLFAPPFRTMPDGRTRVPSNTPGAGENGGVFVHANVWAVIAECLLGRGDRAWQYFRQTFPPRLADADAERYANEPYALSSWIYGPDHERAGTGQLSWLTGGATWTYGIVTQYLLGIRPTLDGLRIAPCLPADWPRARLRRQWRDTTCDIAIENPDGIAGGAVALTVDGQPHAGDLIAPAPGRTLRITARVVQS